MFVTLLYAFKAGIVLLILCTNLTGAIYCRQCHGFQTITFVNKVTTAQATNFMKKSLGSCATGGDYAISSITQDGLKFTFGLQIWRYCGTGGSNWVNKKDHCIDKICSVADSRRLTCTKSVKCGYSSDCYSCGL